MTVARTHAVLSPVCVCLSLGLMIIAGAAHAYPRMSFEQEPNDELSQASVVSGEAHIVGDVTATDRDQYRWVLGDGDADLRWQIELRADADSQVRVELLPAPADTATGANTPTFGAVSAGTSSFGSADQASDSASQSVSDDNAPDLTPLLTLLLPPGESSAVVQGLLVSAGEYLIRVTTSQSGGDYQVLLTEQGAAGAFTAVDAVESDRALDPGRNWGFRSAGSDIMIPLPGDDGDQLWRLTVSGEIGVPLEASIVSATGNTLTDRVSASPLQQSWSQQNIPAASRLRIQRSDSEPVGRVLARIERDGRRADQPANQRLMLGVPDEPDASLPPPLGATPESRAWITLDEPVMLDFSPATASRFKTRYLGFTASKDQAVSLSVIADHEESISVCLKAVTGDAEVCRQGPGDPLFSRMHLPPDDYTVEISIPGAIQESGQYEFSLAATDFHPPGHVTHPNDHSGWAARLQPDQPLTNTLLQQRYAWFELDINGTPQQWRISVSGDSLPRSLALYVKGGENSTPLLLHEQQQGASELWLDHVRLLPGRYLLRVAAEPGEFQVVANALGAAAPGSEIEPNDRAEDAGPVWLGETVTGTFHSAADMDQFQFSLPGENRLAVHLEPPPGLRVTADIYWQGSIRVLRLTADELTESSLRLPQGDYVMVLRADQASGEPYRIQLSVAQPWPGGSLLLPSETRERAPLMPQDGEIRPMMGGEPGQGGWMRLPVSAVERTLSWEGSVHSSGYAHYTGLRFQNADGEQLPATGYGLSQGEVIIPANTEVFVELSFGDGASLVVIDDPGWAPLNIPQPELALVSDTEGVAAYSALGQQAAVELTVNNPADTAQTWMIQHHLSHAGATLSGLPDQVTLDAGEHTSFPASLRLPPDLAEDAPVTAFVSVGDQGMTAQLQLPVSQSAPVSDPFVVAAIDPALQGLTNLAWNALGATFVATDTGEPIDDVSDGRYGEFLINDLAIADNGIDVRSAPGQALPPIRLAGQGGRVHAIVVNQRSPQSPAQRWRELEISVGSSHDALEPAMVIELKAGDGEQVFPLETPVDARYVGLRPLSLWGGTIYRHGTGVLRVLGEAAAPLADTRHDLLDQALGGHWIHTQPNLASLYGLQGEYFSHNSRMTESIASAGQDIRGRSIEMVFAFLQQRAARLDELRWVDNPDWSGLPIEEVEVFTSEISPVGPWQRQGLWELMRDEQAVAQWRFDAPVNARYLRLVFDEPALPPEQDKASWRIPQALQAFEADSLGNQRSILGYWGVDHSRGPYEAGLANAPVSEQPVEDSTSTEDDPHTLVSEVTGRVSEPGDGRHYRLRLEAGDNTLSFALSESSQGRLEATLLSPQGEQVALQWQQTGNTQRVAEAVGLAPGDYHLSLVEPPRSVAFLWDGSLSVAHHQPAIYQALNRFAEALQPGREVFNLMPLGGPLLVDGWADSPSQVGATLGAYDGQFQTSNSEPALRSASRALAEQNGEKAIFLITDAVPTARDMLAWRSLAEVKPRIFTIQLANGDWVSTAEQRWHQNQLMGWANIAGGRYQYASNRSELVQALETGMRELRSATTFVLDVQQTYVEPPQPGTLRVISGDTPVAAAGAVHMIFDASGSMLRQMQGGRRIEVARRILDQVLDERIPPHVPIALRVFGHTAAHSCETELLVAPASGSHADARQAIAEIQAINLARTPLAASLDAVPDDLSGISGTRRLVVMLTDGEETCEGDLDESVAQLVSEGLDVRLNIVGFHIDELELQAEFERLAEITGGHYFDSRDEEELTQALADALAANWQVVDLDGVNVAQGRVDGGRVSLLPGEYELRVQTQDGERRHTFRIEPEEDLTLEAVSDD